MAAKIQKQSIAKALDRVMAAEEAVIKKLQAKWPEDSAVQCYIRTGQKRPSVMKVIGYTGKGYVRVGTIPSNPRGVREVYFTSIMD